VTLKIRRVGKSRRLSRKRDLAHKPSAVGQGKWHSRTALWAYKRSSRRRRLIANASRRRNRAAS
jgi:hypothetical protein